MGKLRLLLAVPVALVALLGLSAQALAVHDPGCDTYNNDVGIFEFNLDTPDSHRSGDVSSVGGSGFACGSDLTLTGGDDTLYNHADIVVPPGVEIADSDLVPIGSDSNPDGGSFAGIAKVHILMRLFGGPLFLDGDPDPVGIPSTVRAYDKAKCRSEKANEIVGDTPQGPIVSCLKGSNPLGENWSWTTLVSQDPDRYALTIGPMHASMSGVSSGPGLTYVNLELCGYFGGTDPVEPGDLDCGGTGDQFQQKNGDASAPDCSNGNGLYTITATMEDGTTVTPQGEDCVPFEGGVETDSDCDGTPYNNDYAVHEFGVATTPTTSGALSDITFNYLVCGTALGAGDVGDETANDHVDIKQPPTSVLEDTFDIATGSYAGRLKGRIAYRDQAGDAQVASTEADLTVEWADLRFLERERWARDADDQWIKTNPIEDNCNRQADPGVSNVEGDNDRLGPDYLAGENIGTFDYPAWIPTDPLGRPTTSLASFIDSCFKLVSTSGPVDWYAWAWKTFSVVDGHKHLTVGPIHTDPAPPAPDNDDPAAEFNDRLVGFTSTSNDRDPFELTICDNAGAVGSNDCGGPTDPVLHRNGDGEGCYEIVATNKAADKAQAQTACVTWTAGREAKRKKARRLCKTCPYKRPSDGSG